jgi:hypothetical protein
MQNSGRSAKGRTAPPPESQFRKGQSGNPAGRPKGSISINGLTRKVAQKKHRVFIEGKPRRVTTLDLLILKTQAMAASGHVAAARLMNWVRSETQPSDEEIAEGGFLLVPEVMTAEEFIAKEEARTSQMVEPGTEINIATEEFLKACRGEPSPLGEALCAFHKKYGAGPAL